MHDVELPSMGTAAGFDGRRSDTETFFSFTGFTTPGTIYRYDLASGKVALVRQPQVDFHPDDYETRQVFYTSRDGTRVPMFICAKKGLKLDGQNPTLLYGYGGFNISLTPTFLGQQPGVDGAGGRVRHAELARRRRIWPRRGTRPA